MTLQQNEVVLGLERLVAALKPKHTKKSSAFRIKYHIQKLFGDDRDVCAFYNIEVSGMIVFACGWFHVKAGKVSSLRVTFDPRPLLAASDATRSLGS